MEMDFTQLRMHLPNERNARSLTLEQFLALPSSVRDDFITRVDDLVVMAELRKLRPEGNCEDQMCLSVYISTEPVV